VEKFRVNAEDSIFLIVDIQEKLMPAVVSGDMVCKKIDMMLHVANSMDIPVVITEQYPKGLGLTLPEIRGFAQDDMILEKMQFSAFIPDLEKMLIKLSRKTIILAGVETHICVYQTARDLVDKGYSVHVLLDATSSRTHANYENGLSLMKSAGCLISNTETVLFDLMKSAASPHFKFISKLVK